MDSTLPLRRLAASPWILPIAAGPDRTGTETSGWGHDRVTLNAGEQPPTSNARFQAWNQAAPPSRQQAYETRNQQIQQTANMTDPVQRNRNITQDYDHISHDMQGMLGTDAGANWSTWAAWASSRAGETIRGEDVPATSGTRNALGALLTAIPGVGPMLALPAVAANNSYDHASHAVGEGNKMVYQEIAPQFARFIETFRGDQHPDEQKWAQFAKGFSPQQGNLSSGFRHYYDAMFTADPKQKQELTLLGNEQIALHEQTRLDPKINEALPGLGANGLVTNFMHLNLPGEQLHLSQDVPTSHGSAFPPNLQHLTNPNLLAFDSRWDRTPDSLSGSRAHNWGNLGDRMNYIVDMMRSRAMDPALFSQTPR